MDGQRRTMLAPPPANRLHTMQTANPDEPRDSAENQKLRTEAVTWVRTQMALYGLTLDDLTEAGCFSSKPRESPDKESSQKTRYRNADGSTWDGVGEMPEWLKRAVNAGQIPEHFRVD